MSEEERRAELGEYAIDVAEAALEERLRRREAKEGRLVEGTYNAAAARLEEKLNIYEDIIHKHERQE